jgi:signal transduction histidine kinase
MHGVQEADRRIVGNALLSIEYVSRYIHDLDQKRLLIDVHIFQRTTQDMQRVEARILEVDADLARTALAYEPLASFRGERTVWMSLQAEVAGLDAPIGRALDFSRSNLDAEARAAMAMVEVRFQSIEKDADTLIQINRDESGLALARIRALQRTSLIFLGSITAAGTLLALMVAVWVSRLTRRGDEQLKQGALALEARNRELDAFAGRVAHDLRGPLTTISLSATQLANSAPRHEETSDLLQRGVLRMEALIDDLLALSRIDAQAPGASSQVAKVAESVAESLWVEMKSAQGILRVDVEPASVRCSEGLLCQALWNLCDNAIKYRRPGVRLEVQIRGRRVGRRYELRVSDNGSGMTPEEARQAFEPFFRGERMRTTPGTGLGLSIVKRVIAVSDGSISVESAIDEGTTFIVNVPLAEGPIE